MKASLNKIEIYNTYPLKVMFPSTEIPPSAKRAHKSTFGKTRSLISEDFLLLDTFASKDFLLLRTFAYLISTPSTPWQS